VPSLQPQKLQVFSNLRGEKEPAFYLSDDATASGRIHLGDNMKKRQ
jgi:hypothetical protein